MIARYCTHCGAALSEQARFCNKCGLAVEKGMEIDTQIFEGDTAKQAGWKVKPLPSKRARIALNRRFSTSDMRKIQRRLVPQLMEDKWLIYWEQNALYFHRSWTGSCIYVVRFRRDFYSWEMFEADVNRDPEQYKQTSDKLDIEIISYLIDVLLLRQHAVLPAGIPLMGWDLVGRAMSGQHPSDEPYDECLTQFAICTECVHKHRKLTGRPTCDMHLDEIPHNIMFGTCDKWEKVSDQDRGFQGLVFASRIQYVSPEELAKKLRSAQAPLVLDVRIPGEEVNWGPIPGAVNISLFFLEERVGELSAQKQREIVIVCDTGGLSESAAEILLELGFNPERVFVLRGGLKAWWEAKQRK